MKKYALFQPLVFSLALLLAPSLLSAQESYADMTVQNIPSWTLTQMQTFAGNVPSRVWLFEKNSEEVAVAALATEGIENGLKDQNHSKLVKIYLDALIVGWNGKSEGPETGTNAAFCGGESGYKTLASFGNRQFDYYACMMMNKERTGIIMITTWAPHDTAEEIIARRLMTFVQASTFKE